MKKLKYILGVLGSGHDKTLRRQKHEWVYTWSEITKHLCDIYGKCVNLLPQLLCDCCGARSLGDFYDPESEQLRKYCQIWYKFHFSCVWHYKKKSSKSEEEKNPQNKKIRMMVSKIPFLIFKMLLVFNFVHNLCQLK